MLNKFKMNQNKHNSEYVCQVVSLLKVYNKPDYFNEQLQCKHRCADRRGFSDYCEQLQDLFNREKY